MSTLDTTLFTVSSPQSDVNNSFLVAHKLDYTAREWAGGGESGWGESGWGESGCGENGWVGVVRVGVVKVGYWTGSRFLTISYISILL